MKPGTFSEEIKTCHDCRIEVLDTIECPTDGSTFVSNSTHPYCYPKDLETINNYNYVTPMLLAIYLLVGNVMLLNLLIAVFTYVSYLNKLININFALEVI